MDVGVVVVDGEGVVGVVVVVDGVWVGFEFGYDCKRGKERGIQGD